MLKLSGQAAALVAGLIGICGAPAVATADGYYQRSPVAVPFSWTGLYVGFNGGYAWSADQTVNGDETFTAFPGAAPVPFVNANFGSLAPAGGFGGVQVGANLQLGAVVLGIEVDGQWSDISDSSLTTTAVASPTSPYTVGTRNSVTRFGTFRPRVGLAWDRTLLYGTGGVAWGRVAHTLTFADTGGFTALNQEAGTHFGYVVGGGLEHALTSHLSLKVEYQYINLGSEKYQAVEQVGGIATGFLFATDTKTDLHTVRLGLNYKFGLEPAPLK